MEESKIKQFAMEYHDFMNSSRMESRNRQIQLVPILREIIKETLKNDPLKNEHLTGLIQMLGAGCKMSTFEKYLKVNVNNSEKRDEILAKFKTLGETGYTGKGLNKIYKPKSEQLEKIKLFLKEAFSVKTIEHAVKLTKDFDDLKIPQVTSGIYSPWLYYINPKIFPIINNSTLRFREWLKMPSDYPSFIESANQLMSKVNETDHGRLDWFAHLYVSNDTDVKDLNLGDRKFFKISHGSFIKKVPFKKTGILKILEENNWIAMGNDTGLNQFNVFSAEAKLGDYVYVCYGGRSVYAIGEIISEVKSLNQALKTDFPAKDEWSYRVIKPLFFPVDTSVIELKEDRKNFMPSGNSTFWEVPRESIAEINEKIFIPKFRVKFLTEDNSKDGQNEVAPDFAFKNIILFGPPGTGKTYNTINLALEIIDPVFYKNNENNRKKLRERFNELLIKDWENMDAGQIAFTTFHQSMSYEDFVEGIKPFIPDIEAEVEEEQTHKDDVLAYHIQDGIFKRICIKAMNPPVSRFNFDQAWSDFLNYLNNSKDEVIFKSTMSELKLEKNPSNEHSVKLRYLKSSDEPDRESKHVFYVAKETIRKIFNSRLDITDPNVQKWVEVRNIVGGGRATTSYAVYRSFFEFHNLEKVFSTPDTLGSYVLIIDEISRGNVSQILGELITLIEKDKRAGQPEALEVVLPYSKKRFSVPSNLYIIGTMNTADRSVEALDTALRRRFSFVEVMPVYNLLENEDGTDMMIQGISLKALLQRMNERLCYLLDEDHQIGHSFFLSLEDDNDLRYVFKNNIIPQLKEFFYNDHSKIRLVLGDGFVEKIEAQKARPKFAADDEEDFVLEKSMYKIREINDDFEIIEAVRQML